jgi:cell division protein FtsB
MPRQGSPPASFQRRAGQQQHVGPVRRFLTDPRLVAILLLGGIVLVALMGLAIWGDGGFQTLWHTRREVSELSLEVETIEQENARLRTEIDRLRHDPDYIERIAREELGLIRDGEIVIEFVNDGE